MGVRSVRELSYDDLATIVERVRDGLYLDERDDGRAVYTLDKQVSGADYIEWVSLWMSEFDLVPDDVEDGEHDEDDESE